VKRDDGILVNTVGMPPCNILATTYRYVNVLRKRGKSVPQRGSVWLASPQASQSVPQRGSVWLALSDIVTLTYGSMWLDANQILTSNIELSESATHTLRRCGTDLHSTKRVAN
jgi:hypothetical protein